MRVAAPVASFLRAGHFTTNWAPGVAAAATAGPLPSSVPAEEVPRPAVVPTREAAGVGRSVAERCHEVSDALRAGPLVWEGGTPLRRGRYGLHPVLAELVPAAVR